MRFLPPPPDTMPDAAARRRRRRRCSLCHFAAAAATQPRDMSYFIRRRLPLRCFFAFHAAQVFVAVF